MYFRYGHWIIRLESHVNKRETSPPPQKKNIESKMPQAYSALKGRKKFTTLLGSISFRSLNFSWVFLVTIPEHENDIDLNVWHCLADTHNERRASDFWTFPSLFCAILNTYQRDFSYACENLSIKIFFSKDYLMPERSRKSWNPDYVDRRRFERDPIRDLFHNESMKWIVYSLNE